jgi:hypothetical protein
MKMSTFRKGEIAKLKVEQRAIEKGWIVSRTVEWARYDLILDDGRKRYRIQVKYADSNACHSKNALSINLRKWSKGRRLTKKYNRTEIDAILVYIPRTDEICWFGSEHFHDKGGLVIRYAPALNKQQNKCRYTKDFRW